MWAGARRWLSRRELSRQGLSRQAGLSAAAIVVCLAVGYACNGPGPHTANDVKPPPPTLRLYLLSTVAGGLEPCGCTADQLGGLDHVAAFLSSQRLAAPHSLFLTVGPLLFLNPRLTADNAAQDRFKAETIAQSVNDMQLAAWVPGANDWADGSDGLRKYLQLSGTRLLAAGLKDRQLAGSASISGSELFDIGQIKVGIVGFSDPKNRAGVYPEGVLGPPPEQQLDVVQREITELKRNGAQLLVVLAAMDRGSALRIAEGIPELNLLVVGRPCATGDLDDSQQPPTMVGSTLVVETANHGQTIAVVDIHTKGQKPGVLLKLDDGGGIARAQQINALARRIRKLEVRINNWQKGGNVSTEDLAARQADLQRLRQQRAKLESQETQRDSDNTYRYRIQEVREELGVDPEVGK
jgi:2',3'-cyclic-nucleotide 2'-phosphodiesterase (5'-nucleotidase family)